MTETRPTESERLLNTLSPYERFVIVMHDNPDPDAIASGWAMCVLLRERLNKPVRIVGGGGIVRAENRFMVELLSPPIELVNEIEIAETTAAILVDCGSEATNHLLLRVGIQPVAVIDHHIEGKLKVKPAFRDVRPKVVSSVTIVGSYLREQKIEPGKKLATAMVYAMRTETCGNDARYTDLDRSIQLWLTERADPALVAAIENAPLSQAYFGDLALAMQNTFLYDHVAWCFLPRADGAEIVGEVADLLIRCEGVQRVLCAAVIGGDVLLSSRTTREAGNAAAILCEVLDGIGSGGGHAHRAGGKIVNAMNTVGSQSPGHVEKNLRHRWLAACGVAEKRGVRLIPKLEIVRNL